MKSFPDRYKINATILLKIFFYLSYLFWQIGFWSAWSFWSLIFASSHFWEQIKCTGDVSCMDTHSVNFFHLLNPSFFPKYDIGLKSNKRQWIQNAESEDWEYVNNLLFMCSPFSATLLIIVWKMTFISFRIFYVHLPWLGSFAT